MTRTDEIMARYRADSASYWRSFHAHRIEAGKCCGHVHPTGTSKWRYCKQPSVSTDENGLTYCKRHLPTA